LIDPIPVDPFRNLSAIRRAVVVASIGAAATVVIVMAVVSTALWRQAVDDAERNMTAVSKLTGEQASQTLVAVDFLARSIQDLAIRPALPDEAALLERTTTAEFHETLVRRENLLPQVAAIVVIGADGDILSTTRQFPAPQVNMAHGEFFKKLKERPDRGLVVTEPILLPGNGQWLFYLARPLRDSQGGFAGGVLVEIPAAYFERYFSTIDIGAESSVALLSPAAELIARWPRAEGATGKVFQSALNQLEQPVGAGTAIRKVLGTDQVLRRVAVSEFSVGDNRLFVTVGRSNRAIVLPWRNASIWIASFAALSVAIIAVMAKRLFRALRDEEAWRDAAVERETQLSLQTTELATARDQAQAANRARGEFLANVSHELRTPLNAILGFSEILQKELFGPLGDSRYRDFVTYIHGSGLHLLEIVGNILDLTKIDVGRLELDEHEVDIVDMMQLCVRLVGDAAAAGRVDLEFQNPAGRPLLWADPTRLKQILFNLLSNAIKFTPAGKRVVLSAGDADGGYFIMVSDAGIGMSPEDLEDAMQPFRQIDNSLAKRYQGTGLGLPLTKSLVELHGGVLEIQSEPGKGTTAIVTLPVRRVLNLREPNAPLRASGRS
jgi:signal transduction histidine kinase